MTHQAPSGMQQAWDFRDETHVLAALVDPLDARSITRPTLFKSWTVADIFGHLHMFDRAATLTATDTPAFHAFISWFEAGLKAERTMLDLQNEWLDGLSGHALIDAWRDGAEETARVYAGLDPRARLKWAGPDMSARSCITARQMETWAHGQAVFDLLGVEREETDRIRNIAHLGVTTFRWTFLNRGQEPPGPPPHVRLIAPSGAVWEWNAPSEHDRRDDSQQDSRVEGTAVDFCRVVTQTRHVADTALRVTGEAAERWMAIAQCFAGPPVDPSAPGARHKAVPGE
ncbi:MAG: TIGR03084 family metal-binding protein [Bauldia litoralis]